MLSIALRDLHIQYPNQFETGVDCCYPEVFYNNPYVTRFVRKDGIPIICVDYAHIRERNKQLNIHFSDAFVLELNELLHVNIQKMNMYPDVHLNDEEISDQILCRLNITKPFWLLNAGFKMDIPLKAYPPAQWQKVVDMLTEKGVNVYQVGHSHDVHPILNNCKSLVGKTDKLRDYFSLMYHAEGSIGVISLHMHLAAAMRKKCIVVAGGREDVKWEKYPNHHFLHTIGKLSCCKEEGCWKSKRSKCSNLNRYPECLNMISPELIVNHVA